jgi:hypothetical protein
LRGLVVELGERGLKVDYRTVWSFVHLEGLSFKKKAFCRPSRIVPTWRGIAPDGRNIRVGLIRPGWCSSTRRGRRPTWRRCGGGAGEVTGSRPRSRTAIGKR